MLVFEDFRKKYEFDEGVEPNRKGCFGSVYHGKKTKVSPTDPEVPVTIKITTREYFIKPTLDTFDLFDTENNLLTAFTSVWNEWSCITLAQGTNTVKVKHFSMRICQTDIKTKYLLKCYMCMEKLKGDLDELYLKSYSQMSLKKFETLTKSMLQCLTYFDEHSMFHTDIRPKNICEDAEGQFKLIDFNGGRVTFSNSIIEKHEVLRSTEFTMPSYDFNNSCRPEVRRANDRFGLGMTLFALATKTIDSVQLSEIGKLLKTNLLPTTERETTEVFVSDRYQRIKSVYGETYVSIIQSLLMGSDAPADLLTSFFPQASEKKICDIDLQIENLKKIGEVLISEKRMEEGKNLLEEARKLGKSQYGQNTDEYLKLLKSIITIFWDADSYPDYIEHGLEYLRVEEKIHPNQEKDSKVYHNLGYSYDELGMIEEAIKCYEKALSIQKALLGQRHSDFGLLLNNTGISYKRLGKPEEAIQYYETALQFQKIILGEDHPDYALALHNVGNSYYALKAYDKALNCYEKSEVIRKEKLGVTSDDYKKTLEYLNETREKLDQKK